MKIVACFCTLMVLAMVPAAFAGKTELTTYYPSAYGEYINLKSTADSSFATASGNVGIGTTTPVSKLQVCNPTKSGGLLTALTVSLSDESATLNPADVVAIDISKPYSGINYVLGRITASHNNSNDYSDGWLAFSTRTANTTPTEKMRITSAGNVGIGTTAPTVQFERACPSGFTSIKAGNNQLGCMETAEHGSGSWYVGADTCFTAYGGRLPSYSEWYVAMNNYGLTGETGNWEWVDAPSATSTCGCVGGSTLTGPITIACTTVYAYRCWIPN